jgi:DNA-binding PadR family transcriptional regulator
MPGAKKRELTMPDLVLLSLLAEQPMHGYQANLELERRQVQDWAALSRPQIYYSLEKLERLGLIEVTGDEAPALGPERRIFATTPKGQQELATALEREDWTCQRDRPPFLTWIILSWQARPGMFEKQLERRRKFLEDQLAREEATLEEVRKEVGHDFHEVVWVLTLMIEQFRTELRWISKVAGEIGKRAPSKFPAHVPQDAE